jgi:nucleoside-diphosphate-sugar epimerase
MHDNGTEDASGPGTPQQSGPGTPQRRAFVAGATGHTGRALVAELCAQGVLTTAHVRPDSPDLTRWRTHFAGLGARVDESAWSEAAMTAALARHRPDAVFALLGTTRARGRAARTAGSTETYETVDYGLTVILLQATSRSAPHARFVYLSAIGVGPGRRGSYVRARWRAERELRGTGLDWTIVRPAVIAGERDEGRPLERVAARVGDALLAVLGALGARRLRQRYRSITAVELARALARCAFDEAADRRVLYGDALR